MAPVFPAISRSNSPLLTTDPGPFLGLTDFFLCLDDKSKEDSEARMCADWNRQGWYPDPMPKQQRPIKAAPEEPPSFFSSDFDSKHYTTDPGYPTGDDPMHHGTIDPSRMPYSNLSHVTDHTSLGVGQPQHHQALQPMPHTAHQPAHALHHTGQSTAQQQPAPPAPPAPTAAPQAPAPKTPTQPNPKKRQRSGGAKGAAANATGAATEAGTSGSPPKRSRTNTAWTQQEEQLLKQMRDQGRTWSEIAKSFPSRTEGSVKKHWYKVG